ncbi:hypothetical protein GCM10027425_17000 [Alteromonas gracilis]
MTIHSGHPFATPEPDRDPVRRVRGRLGGTVTVWAAGSGPSRAGLTVSSLVVALGEPARVIGLLDPEADLAERLLAEGTVVVSVLDWEQRRLGGMFAGTDPAPGGAFAQAAFEDTPWGPRLAGAAALGCRLESTREVGWSTEVCCTVEQAWIEDATAGDPMVHHRGRYRRLEG